MHHAILNNLFHTEVLVCLEAISFAMHHWFTHISFMTDCLHLIHCFSNAKFIPYSLINVFHDIKSLVSFLLFYHIAKVERSVIDDVLKLAVSLTTL